MRIVASKEELEKSFEGEKIHYSPLMDEMLGKDFVVKTMEYGGAGIASPDGTQKETWYFPLKALTPWLATNDAKKPPIAATGDIVVGLPTRAQVEIGTPGRHDNPWDYHVKGRNLMDPIAPSYTERVDLEETAMPMPPWTKVKQVISIECMDKLHKDPSHLCDPEAYTNYKAVAPAPTKEPVLTAAEAEKLKAKIKRLQGTIKALSPTIEPRVPAELVFKAPGIRNTEETMNTAGSDLGGAGVGAGKKMRIGAKASDERLHTAGGYGETVIKVKYGKDDQV